MICGDIMNYILIGKFQGTHGLKGEIKLKSDFEYLNKVLVKGFNFYIGESKDKEKFLSSRPHKDYYLVLFDNINSIEDIEKYINKNVYILREDLKLDSNSYVLEDLLDKEVYFKDKYLGVITSINNYGSSNYVMEITGDSEILIPYKSNFIDSVSDKVYLKDIEVFLNED